MVILEMRDAAYDTAFDLVDDAKHSAKKTKLALCKLEDALYDCYEASKKEDYEFEDEGSEYLHDMMARKSGYRHGEHDDYEDEDEDYEKHHGMRGGRRRSSRGGMRMRRNRMGRFV